MILVDRSDSFRERKPTRGTHTISGAPLAIATALAGAAAAAVALGASGVVDGAAPSIVTCPLRALTGLPCPLCGMTHSLISFGNGDFLAGLSQAPAIPLVLALTITLLVLGPVALIRGRGLRFPAWGAVAVVTIVVVAWALRLSATLPGLATSS